MRTHMKSSCLVTFIALLMAFTTASAQTGADAFNYYLNPNTERPLTVNPLKWVRQPSANSWESMEQAVGNALSNRDGYGLYQLAYLEYVHNFTNSKLNPKTMLYQAFEIGKSKADPYLMYWVTDFEGTAYYRFEYLQRRRNHAYWTDSVATEKREIPVLKMLAELNDKSFQQMKSLAEQYLQCAYLKEETYGLLSTDLWSKIQDMEKNSAKK